MTLLLSQMETQSKGKKGGNAEPSARERQRRALCLCHAYASHARAHHGQSTTMARPPRLLRRDKGDVDTLTGSAMTRDTPRSP